MVILWLENTFEIMFAYGTAACMYRSKLSYLYKLYTIRIVQLYDCKLTSKYNCTAVARGYVHMHIYSRFKTVCIGVPKFTFWTSLTCSHTDVEYPCSRIVYSVPASIVFMVNLVVAAARSYVLYSCLGRPSAHRVLRLLAPGGTPATTSTIV